MFPQVVLEGEVVLRTRDAPRGRAGHTKQGRPHLPGRPRLQGWSFLVVRPCLARVVCWSQFLPKCIPTYENHNTTHGTLLVLKMCMKFVINSSRTWGFDGRIFVVRTVNRPLEGHEHWGLGRLGTKKMRRFKPTSQACKLDMCCPSSPIEIMETRTHLLYHCRSIALSRFTFVAMHSCLHMVGACGMW
jgi:hypothetical protein